MSNHIHMVVQAQHNNLSDLIRDFKKFTARTLLNEIQTTPESRRGMAEEVITLKFLWSKLDYIHLNPVRAGWVEHATDYIYSSASNYSANKGVLGNVEIAENPVIDVLEAIII